MREFGQGGRGTGRGLPRALEKVGSKKLKNKVDEEEDLWYAYKRHEGEGQFEEAASASAGRKMLV